MKQLGTFLIVLFTMCFSFQGVAAEQAKCYPIATLKISFHVVFPLATQTVLEGAAAQAYLAEFNSFGNPTKFTGELLFVNILPNGAAMLIPLKDGLGCSRLIVGPKLHRAILAKVARGAL